MTKVPLPGGRLRLRIAGPSVLAVLPILAPGIGRQIAHLIWAGGFFLLSAIILFSVDDPIVVRLVVAFQISVLLLIAISVLCGRRRSILTFVTTFALTTASIQFVFPIMQALTMMRDEAAAGQGSLGRPLVLLFLGVGIREELVKAVPVFLMAMLAWWPRIPRLLVVRDAIDGVLIGAAAGVSFTLLETLGEYVPKITAMVASNGGGAEAQGYYGLIITLARVISSAGGHAAWSGFFGYTIGLAQTYPAGRRPLTLLIGLAVAALLHALWDDFTGSAVTELLIALTSYTLLISAVVSARQRAAAVVRPASTPPIYSRELWLHMGANRHRLTLGTVLTSAEIMGLQAAGPGPVVASVQQSPAAPQRLGLRNESLQTWNARPAGQAEIPLPPGRTVHLTPGLAIRFGSVIALVG